jgi:YD repeat-containing protein
LGNGLQESWGYDVRGRLQSYSAGTAYSFSGLNWAGNGALLGANDAVNGNWTYTYDAFNRLSTAGKTGQAFSYGYDQVGNR